MEQISLPGRNAVADIHRLNPFVFCIISRSTNDNVMCYEFRGGQVKYFWLNLDKGYQHLPKIEKPSKLDWIPYGWTYKRINDTTHEVRLKQMPDRPIIVRTNPLTYQGENNQGGRPCARGYVKINGQDCYLNYVHVTLKTHKIIPVLADVSHIDIFGHNRQQQNQVENVTK